MSTPPKRRARTQQQDLPDVGDADVGDTGDQRRRKRSRTSMNNSPWLAFANQLEWHNWLLENHEKSEGIHIVYHRVSSGLPTIRYQEALEEALCFGWIDSTVHSVDALRYRQYFCPRKEKCDWSDLNKAKMAQLQRQGRLQPAALAAIQRAKQNGAWDQLQRRNAAAMANCAMLDAVLAEQAEISRVYSRYTDKAKYNLRRWIGGAKHEETQRRRVDQFIAAAKNGRHPLTG